MTWLWLWRAGLASSWWGAILREHDIEPTELFSGATKIILGLWLVGPWQTYGGNPRLYGDMAILPEWAWGTALVALGVGHLLALRHGESGWRRWAAFAGFLAWVSLGGAFVHTQPTALIGPTMLALAAGQGWCYIRLGLLAR